MTRMSVRTWILATVGVLGVVAALAYLGVAVGDLRSQVEREATARAAADDDRRALAQDVTALREQVIEQGQTPVAPPPSVDPVPGLSATQARDIAVAVVGQYGIGREAVTAIVDAAVARVRLTPGPRGEPGPAPTRQEVEAAAQRVVSAWLAAHPPRDGQDGTDGQDGVGIRSAVFDAGSCSIVQTLTDGTVSTFGPLCGRDGQDGVDGQDAFPFTFRYRLPDTGPLRGQEYLCTVTSPDQTGTCEPVE